MDNGTQISGTKNWEELAGEANYCPRELARLCSVSLRTLQRRFAQNYAMTISDWMRNVRLAKAYTRVVAGEPIKAVAYDLGFKQLSHFSRVFKEVHGVAPSFVSPRGKARAAAAAPQGTLFPPVALPVIALRLPSDVPPEVSFAGSLTPPLAALASAPNGPQ